MQTEKIQLRVPAELFLFAHFGEKLLKARNHEPMNVSP
jgi:hypothetical protein